MVKTKDPQLRPENMRHYFFLNPYEDAAFTRCPKCESKTLLRKFPLAIHIEPEQFLVLNKTCRYCTRCDLIIAHKSEVETLMVACIEDKKPEIIGNEYLIIGTMEKRDWRDRDRIEKAGLAIERIRSFKDIWDFEVIPRGWYPSKEGMNL